MIFFYYFCQEKKLSIVGLARNDLFLCKLGLKNNF